MPWVDHGHGGLLARSLDAVDDRFNDLYQVLAARSQLFGFAATERFYEIGTPAALAEADAFLRHLTG